MALSRFSLQVTRTFCPGRSVTLAIISELLLALYQCIPAALTVYYVHCCPDYVLYTLLS